MPIFKVTASQGGKQYRFSPDFVDILDVSLEIGLESTLGIGVQGRPVFLIVVAELDEVELRVQLQCLGPEPFVKEALGRATVRGEVNAIRLRRQVQAESRPPAPL